MFWYIASSTALGLAGLLIYLYYWRKGQFDDPEDVKYQMFREEE
jgi:cbb3-type cytochrome oxidase maturation protein